MAKSSTPTTTHPADYKHIAAWGALMGSHDTYIKAEQFRAWEDGAPLNAIYRDGSNRPNQPIFWHTADTIKNEDTRNIVERRVKKLKG